MLMVGRTGIGKTHFMRMLGTVLGDITLNFTQLLSLSADQMATLKGAHQDYGSVEAHNLDESSGNTLDTNPYHSGSYNQE